MNRCLRDFLFTGIWYSILREKNEISIYPKRGIFEGDLDEGELEIGQIAALIEDLPPAGEILRRLVAEYEAARGSLGPL